MLYRKKKYFSKKNSDSVKVFSALIIAGFIDLVRMRKTNISYVCVSGVKKY